LTIERFVGGGEKRVENVAKLLFFINDGREEMASISINLLPTPTS